MIWARFLEVLDAAESADQPTLKRCLDEFNRVYRRMTEAQQGAFHADVADLMKAI
jgi:hypothetical protein